MEIIKDLYEALQRIRGIKPRFVIAFIGDEPLAIYPESEEVDPRLCALVYSSYVGLEATVKDIITVESSESSENLPVLEEVMVTLSRKNSEMYLCIYGSKTSLGLHVLLGVLVEGKLHTVHKAMIRTIARNYMIKLVNYVETEYVAK